MPSIPEQLDALAVDDDLIKGSSSFPTGWVKLSGYLEIGAITATGWRVVAGLGEGVESTNAAGACKTAESYLDEGTVGPGVKAQISADPGASLRYLSLNLRLNDTSYGVRAKFIRSSAGVYKLRLEDWENSNREVLTEVEGVKVAVNGEIALFVVGEIAYVWAKPTEEGEWEQVAEAAVGVGGAYMGQYVTRGGLDAAGNIGRLKNFAVGQIEPPPPSATTSAATGIAITKATLNGTVNPEGTATTALFEYGETEALGTKAGESSAGKGSQPVAKEHKLEGLKSGTKYFFRVVASNAGGEDTGEILSFTTFPAIPPTVITLPATGITPTSATLNGTVNPNELLAKFWFEYWKGAKPLVRAAQDLGAAFIYAPETATDPLSNWGNSSSPKAPTGGRCGWTWTVAGGSSSGGRWQKARWPNS